MKTHNFQITNADTDSISFCKPDQSPWTDKEIKNLLNEINNISEEGIFWDNDGVMEKFIIVKAKNYIMVADGEVKIKGSGLKATKKEPRFKRFINDVIQYLIDDRLDEIINIYMECSRDILKIDNKTDLSEYCFKITVTKKVISPTTTFNKKILDALIRAKITPIEGDKHYLMYRTDGELSIAKLIDTEIIDKKRLLKKLFDTMKQFQKIVDIKEYPNLTLKRNQKRLDLLKMTI